MLALCVTRWGSLFLLTIGQTGAFDYEHGKISQFFTGSDPGNGIEARAVVHRTCRQQVVQPAPRRRGDRRGRRSEEQRARRRAGGAVPLALI